MPSLQPYLIYLKGGAMLLIILLACAMTHRCDAAHHRAVVSGIEASHSKATASQLRATMEKERRDRAKLAAISQRHADQLRGKENENDRLRDAVDSGATRLRVAARCPVVPDAGPGGPVDHGTGAELDADARPTYHALRRGIVRIEARLSACQATLMADRE